MEARKAGIVRDARAWGRALGGPALDVAVDLLLLDRLVARRPVRPLAPPACSARCRGFLRHADPHQEGHRADDGRGRGATGPSPELTRGTPPSVPQPQRVAVARRSIVIGQEQGPGREPGPCSYTPDMDVL